MATERTRPTILIVDDHADIRLMCRVNLALEGFGVLEADGGEEGLRVASAELPDLILLDIMMPGTNGWQVLERLKADPATAEIPVVLLTARVQREDEIRGWLSGAAEYLPKPFNPSTLTDVVSRTLRPDADSERRVRALEKLRIL